MMSVDVNGLVIKGQSSKFNFSILCEQQAVNIYYRQYFHVYCIILLVIREHVLFNIHDDMIDYNSIMFYYVMSVVYNNSTYTY